MTPLTVSGGPILFKWRLAPASGKSYLVARPNGMTPVEPAARQASASLRFIRQFLERDARPRLTGLLLGQLDAFNRISTTFGHAQSDEFCAAYAEQLSRALPVGTPIIRLSERRFAILVGVDTMSAITDVATQITEEQQPEVQIGRDSLLADITLGIAVYPTHADDAASLFHRAELALKDARERELAFDIYRPGATQQQATGWKLESDLQRAIEHGALEVFYQPKIDIAAKRVSGLEALARWRTDNGHFVSPQEFIPLAERSGSIVALSWLVFDRVARTAESWAHVGEPFSVAINVAPQVLAHPEFSSRLAKLKDCLAQYKTDVVIELTEDSLIQGDPETIFSLQRLRRLGVGLAIDDFGKAYSSPSYLKHIPATEIKIDKRFVATIAVDEKDRQIVKAIVDLAHASNMRVVGVGVDSEESLGVIEALGCETAQGFFIARPMRGELVGDWIRAYGNGAVLVGASSRGIGVP